MSTVGIIVQARATSTRLPGKVLKPIEGRTALAHVLHRCRSVRGVDVVCCAVAEGSVHDGVAEEAAACGAEVVRGSESDVLDRYHCAAERLNLATVLRVTSDCPLIDPDVCGRVLARLVTSCADYACNNMPPSFPHGLDCEAFTAAALARAAHHAVAPYEREHVTPWLRNADTIRRVSVEGPGGEIARLRWTLDYQEDFHFMTQLFSRLPAFPYIAGYEEVLRVVAGHPELTAINAFRHDENRMAGQAVR
jgi:spore coat polysaccharide biosynthesis protein SpsF